MKTLVLIVLAALVFASCSKNETSSDPIADLTVKSNMVAESQWVISQFMDSGKDETSDYSEYKFKFNNDGTLLAISSSATFNGTWVLAQGQSNPDDSGNNSGDDKLHKLTITISGNSYMDDLSHKWLVDKITSTEIWLRDDNLTSNEVVKFGR